MALSRRHNDAESRRAAINGVAAYLADEDADVYNITDAGVRNDGLGLALNLTALAAMAITDLAAATGRTPIDVLQSMDERRRGRTFRSAEPRNNINE